MYEPREFTTAMFGVFNSAKMFLLVSGFVSTESCSLWWIMFFFFLTRSKRGAQRFFKMPLVDHTMGSKMHSCAKINFLSSLFCFAFFCGQISKLHLVKSGTVHFFAVETQTGWRCLWIFGGVTTLELLMSGEEAWSTACVPIHPIVVNEVEVSALCRPLHTSSSTPTLANHGTLCTKTHCHAGACLDWAP